MIFRLILTDNKDQIENFTITHISGPKLVADLEDIFKGSLLPKEKIGELFSVLYHLKIETEGDGTESIIENLINPESLNEISSWQLSPKHDFEDELIEFLEAHDTFQQIGIDRQ